jgi:hypothetical protein
MSPFAISDAEGRLIPSSGMRGPVPLLTAIMTFVMVVVAAAGLALANTGSVIRAGVEHRYSIQIADGAARAPAAIAAARANPGVGRVEQVDPSELRRTLENGLTVSAEADLPLPAVIDVDSSPVPIRRRSLRRSTRRCCRPASSPIAPVRRCSRPQRPHLVCPPVLMIAGQRGGISYVQGRSTPWHDRGDARHRRDRRPGRGLFVRQRWSMRKGGIAAAAAGLTIARSSAGQHRDHAGGPAAWLERCPSC